ncbi:MAG: TRAP transporter TatT component family protein [Desulfobacterales bacterium]|jgi:hypothetical protein
MHKIINRTLVFVISVGILSCSGRQLLVNEMARVLETGMSTFEQDDDLIMLETALPANIKLLEVLLANDPANFKILVMLSRLYAGYTFAFVEPELERMSLKGRSLAADSVDFSIMKNTLDRYYGRGADYALQAIELNHPDCRRKLANVSTVDSVLQNLGGSDLPAIFWYGFNLAGYVSHNRDSVEALSKVFLVEKIMKRVIELDAAYFHGSAHLVLIAYHASRSPSMGGEPDLALAHYKKLMQIAGKGFLLADLYYARYYLYQMQKRSEYVRVLRDIIRHSSDEKAYRLLNKVARERAAIYLRAADRLFEH